MAVPLFAIVYDAEIKYDRGPAKLREYLLYVSRANFALHLQEVRRYHHPSPVLRYAYRELGGKFMPSEYLETFAEGLKGNLTKKGEVDYHASNVPIDNEYVRFVGAHRLRLEEYMAKVRFVKEHGEGLEKKTVVGVGIKADPRVTPLQLLQLRKEAIAQKR